MQIESGHHFSFLKRKKNANQVRLPRFFLEKEETCTCPVTTVTSKRLFRPPVCITRPGNFGEISLFLFAFLFESCIILVRTLEGDLHAVSSY